MSSIVQNACPYCGIRARDSDDHVFPQFLGGKSSIRACKTCNDVFGHTFEGSASRDLASLTVTLRRLGLRAPRLTVWKRALKSRDTQIEYDLDSDLNAYPSRTVVQKIAGKLKGVLFPSMKLAQQAARRSSADGKAATVSKPDDPDVDLGNLTMSLVIGPEFRRLALKMSVAAADYINLNICTLDPVSRAYLLQTDETSDRIRLDLRVHSVVEALRPPLSHFIYVKGNAATGRCYGIVGIYGAIQLYVILNDKDFRSESFAVFGTLDPAANYRETIEKADLFLLPEAPIRSSQPEAERILRVWTEKFAKEGKRVFGDRFLGVAITTGPTKTGDSHNP